jgi:hypothetical protein
MWPEWTTDMTRHQFDTNVVFAGRLDDVIRRPLENDPSIAISLLRLEFEVFHRIDGKLLRSNNKFACRELIIGRALPANCDSSVSTYAAALSVDRRKVDSPEGWLALTQSKPWIEIRFGPTSNVDYRQPFDRIIRFDPVGWQVEEYEYDRDKKWVSIRQASAVLRCSDSTIRRKVDALKGEFGGLLVRFTDGGHRRINIALLKHLMND